MELEYEGELQGGDTIARDLIRRAAGRVLEERMGGADLGKIVAWFDQGGALKVSGDERSDLCLKGFDMVPGLLEWWAESASRNGRTAPGRWRRASCCSKDFAAQKRISRSEELCITEPSPSAGNRGMGRWNQFRLCSTPAFLLPNDGVGRPVQPSAPVFSTT